MRDTFRHRPHALYVQIVVTGVVFRHFLLNVFASCSDDDLVPIQHSVHSIFLRILCAAISRFFLAGGIGHRSPVAGW
jgi:hypothetical protein